VHGPGPLRFHGEMPLSGFVSNKLSKMPGKNFDRPVKGAPNKLLLNWLPWSKLKKSLLPNSSSNNPSHGMDRNHNRSMAGVES